MEYFEFVEAMRDEVEKLMDEGIRVESHTAVKNNGRQRKGLVIIREGINISPTIYQEEFYEQYQNGSDIPDLAQSVLNLYDKIKVNQSYPCENILSFDKIKDQIVYKLINKKWNEKLLTEVPYTDFLDLAVVFYIILEHSDFGNATVMIRNEHIRQWGITAEDLYKISVENTNRILPVEINKMTDFMYVLTNSNRSLGASAILYSGVCEKLSGMLGGKFYILPSSIHELIIIPESYGIDKEHLQMMVEEINETEVEQEEVLSDNVYYYDGELIR